PTPTPTPTPVPTPVPTPTVLAIAEARATADGTTVTVAGTLTTDLGAIDSARIGFVQDASGGIAVRLDAALVPAIPAGTTVAITGTVGSYFSLRTVNTTAAGIVPTGTADLPDPIGVTTGAAAESLEGLRLAVSGVVTESPSTLADGLGVTIDDGSGPLRLVVTAAAQGAATISTGDTVGAIGSLGQRDSSGTGAAGYRLHITLPRELTVTPPPQPTPTPSPTPVPTANPTPTPIATPTPTPTPMPTPTPLPTPTPPPAPTAGSPIPEAPTRPLGHVGSR